MNRNLVFCGYLSTSHFKLCNSEVCDDINIRNGSTLILGTYICSEVSTPEPPISTITPLCSGCIDMKAVGDPCREVSQINPYRKYRHIWVQIA